MGKRHSITHGKDHLIVANLKVFDLYLDEDDKELWDHVGGDDLQGKNPGQPGPLQQALD